MKTILRKNILMALLTVYTTNCLCQDIVPGVLNDTLPIQTMDSITVNARIKQFNASYLTDVIGAKVYAGKRTNTLTLSQNINGLSFNLGRTALAKIPGLTMWEMDGAGTQLNIGSRGTDSHRSIEMNMRQDGYNTNSDLFGYPEDHYTVPLQAVEEIQLVRGSAALQFGPQFGGMMNYKMKEGDTTRVFGAELEQTAGNNNFFNSFNAVGGTKGRFNYYTYYDNRHGDGWRDNAKFNYHAYYIHLGYQLSDKVGIKAEFSRMDYVQQIAGGLTDQQFEESAKQSVRARNYFQPIINIPAVILNYNISPGTHLEVTSHALFGQRNSVQFINAPNIPDTFNTALGTYNPRQVDRDYYSGFTTEARLLHIYKIGKLKSVITGGLRYFHQLTKRKQKGTGTTGSDFDLTLTNDYGIDLRFTTDNYAAFAENIFQLTPEISFTPGVRYELINTDLEGMINNRTANVSYSGNRNFPVFGAGLQYDLNSSSQLVANISQAYRPYLYSNVTPADRLDQIDPSLKDSKGYDVDFGYRGRIKNVFQFDLDVFYLFYGNKIGLVTRTNDDGSSYLLTTNVGNSVAKGVEAFGELSLLKLIDPTNRSGTDVRIFSSVAFDEAKYTSGVINKGGMNIDISGNYVENTPKWIVKSGLEARYKAISTSFQYAFTSKTFNDAFNTASGSNGVIGLIPAYDVWDWNCSWRFSKQFHLSASINNLTDQKYFNRRITMYPGPGILPADGRTFTVSLGVNI
jgi:Fe(3+) dicitrate transport protein